MVNIGSVMLLKNKAPLEAPPLLAIRSVATMMPKLAIVLPKWTPVLAILTTLLPANRSMCLRIHFDSLRSHY